MDIPVSIRDSNLQINLTLQLTVQGLQNQRNMDEQDFLRYIQEESGAQVIMSEGDWPEKNLTLRGSCSVIFRSLGIIIDKLQENISRVGAHSEGPKSLISLHLVVPASQYYGVLWQGGPRIRDICSRTSAQVHIPADTLSNNTQFSMTVTGQPNCVSDSLKQICMSVLETLVSVPQEGDGTFHVDGQEQGAKGCAEGQSHAEDYAESQRAEVSAYALSQRHSEDSTNVENHPYAWAQSYTEGSTYAGGNPYAGGYPYTGGYPHFEGYPNPYSYYLPGQPLCQPDSTWEESITSRFVRPMEQPSYSMYACAPQRHTVYELMIPNRLIGSVIGFNGDNISEIRRRSGACIRIFPPMANSMRLVRIRGTPASIKQAYYMLSFSVNNRF